jgi:hypothetical protein
MLTPGRPAEDAEAEEPTAGRRRPPPLRASTAPTGSPHPRRTGSEERGRWQEGERPGQRPVPRERDPRQSREVAATAGAEIPPRRVAMEPHPWGGEPRPFAVGNGEVWRGFAGRVTTTRSRRGRRWEGGSRYCRREGGAAGATGRQS